MKALVIGATGAVGKDFYRLPSLIRKGTEVVNSQVF